MKKTITLLFVSLFFISCSNDDDNKQPEEPQIIVDKEEIPLKIGEKHKMDINIINHDKNIPLNLEAFMENEEVATIYSNMQSIEITGKSEGETYVDIKYGGAEKKIKITVGNTYDLEAYYHMFCYDYRVKDTTALKIMSITVDGAITHLFGSREDKLWIGKFDINSKEQIKEYTTNKAISFNRKIHTGFGKYENVTINDISINSFFETDNGWVADLNFHDNESSHELAQKQCLLVFNEGNDTQEYFSRNFDDPLKKWYNDSFVKKIDLENEDDHMNHTWFYPDGIVIASGLLGHHHIPVSYDKYIGLYEASVTTLMVGISIHSLSDPENSKNETFWYETKYQNEGTTLTYEILSNTNDVWTIKVCVSYYSGHKVYKTYEIDIKNETIKEIV